MRIETTDPNGNPIVVFDLTGRSVFADGDWVYGQVEVYSRSIVFVVDITEFYEKGWVALDEFLKLDVSACPTEPSEATITTIPPETTSTTSEPTGSIPNP